MGTDNISLLIIINPFYIKNELIYEIDNFLIKGGNILFFADPFAETIYNDIEKINDYHKFKPLFKSWGIKFLNKKIVLDISLSKEIKYLSGKREYISLYPLWLDFIKSSFNKNDIIINQINKLSLS